MTPDQRQVLKAKLVKDFESEIEAMCESGVIDSIREITATIDVRKVRRFLKKNWAGLSALVPVGDEQ